MKYHTKRTCSKRIMYIVEGETEERFFGFLKQQNFIASIVLRKHNLMQKRLQDGQEILKSKVASVYCVLDTDCVEKSNLETLAFNLEKLKQICPQNTFLLIQNKNFEQELSFVLECKDLCDLFNLKHTTLKDLKNYLAQKVNYARHITSANLVRYCCRPNDFKAELKSHNQMQYEEKVVCFESFCTRKVNKK